MKLFTSPELQLIHFNSLLFSEQVKQVKWHLSTYAGSLHSEGADYWATNEYPYLQF